MGSVDYREQAQLCLLAADGTRDPAERIRLLEVAQKYLRLAEYIQTDNYHSTVHARFQGDSDSHAPDA